MIYVIMFMISTLLGTAASKATGRMKLVLCVVAIIPLCYLAGVRNFMVGTDLLSYAWPTYYECDTKSIVGVFQSYVSSIEPLFLIYSWVTVRLFGTFEAYLFCLQLAVCLPLVWYLYRYHPDNIGTGLFVYSFMFYCFTLNIMRQSIAAAILLLSFHAAQERKLAKFLLFVMAAAGFHATGFFGLVLWPVALLFSPTPGLTGTQKKRKVELQTLYILVAIIALVLTIVFGEAILIYANSLKSSYVFHLRNMGRGDASFLVLLFFMMASMTYLLLARKAKKGGEDGRQRFEAALPYVATLCIATLLSQFSIVSPELVRIGTMFLIFYAPFFAEMMSASRTREEKLLVMAIMCAICL